MFLVDVIDPGERHAVKHPIPEIGIGGDEVAFLRGVILLISDLAVFEDDKVRIGIPEFEGQSLLTLKQARVDIVEQEAVLLLEGDDVPRMESLPTGAGPVAASDGQKNEIVFPLDLLFEGLDVFDLPHIALGGEFRGIEFLGPEKHHRFLSLRPGGGTGNQTQ